MSMRMNWHQSRTVVTQDGRTVREEEEKSFSQNYSYEEERPNMNYQYFTPRRETAQASDYQEDSNNVPNYSYDTSQSQYNSTTAQGSSSSYYNEPQSQNYAEPPTVQRQAPPAPRRQGLRGGFRPTRGRGGGMGRGQPGPKPTGYSTVAPVGTPPQRKPTSSVEDITIIDSDDDIIDVTVEESPSKGQASQQSKQQQEELKQQEQIRQVEAERLEKQKQKQHQEQQLRQYEMEQQEILKRQRLEKQRLAQLKSNREKQQRVKEQQDIQRQQQMVQRQKIEQQRKMQQQLEQQRKLEEKRKRDREMQKHLLINLQQKQKLEELQHQVKEQEEKVRREQVEKIRQLRKQQELVKERIQKEQQVLEEQSQRLDQNVQTKNNMPYPPRPGVYHFATPQQSNITTPPTQAVAAPHPTKGSKNQGVINTNQIVTIDDDDADIIALDSPPAPVPTNQSQTDQPPHQIQPMPIGDVILNQHATPLQKTNPPPQGKTTVSEFVVTPNQESDDDSDICVIEDDEVMECDNSQSKNANNKGHDSTTRPDSTRPDSTSTSSGNGEPGSATQGYSLKCRPCGYSTDDHIAYKRHMSNCMRAKTFHLEHNPPSSNTTTLPSKENVPNMNSSQLNHISPPIMGNTVSNSPQMPFNMQYAPGVASGQMVDMVRSMWGGNTMMYLPQTSQGNINMGQNMVQSDQPNAMVQSGQGIPNNMVSNTMGMSIPTQPVNMPFPYAQQFDIPGNLIQMQPPYAMNSAISPLIQNPATNLINQGIIQGPGGNVPSEPSPDTSEYEPAKKNCCPHCNKKIVGVKRLQKHIRKSHKEILFLPGYRSKQLQNKSDTAMPIPNSPYKEYHCLHCNINLKGRSIYMEHLEIEHGNLQFGAQKKNPSCCFCDFKSTTACKYNIGLIFTNHLRQVHLKYKPFFCPLCEYSSSVPTCVTSHLRLKHKSNKTYITSKDPLKEKEFQIALNMTIKELKDNSKKTNESVKKSNDSSSSRSTKALDSDSDASTIPGDDDAQEKQSAFVCCFCSLKTNMDSSFSLQKHLMRNHLMINGHCDYRPYNCPYCIYKSSTKSNTTNHVRKVHPSQRVTFVYNRLRKKEKEVEEALKKSRNKKLKLKKNYSTPPEPKRRPPGKRRLRSGKSYLEAVIEFSSSSDDNEINLPVKRVLRSQVGDDTKDFVPLPPSPKRLRSHDEKQSVQSNPHITRSSEKGSHISHSNKSAPGSNKSQTESNKSSAGSNKSATGSNKSSTNPPITTRNKVSVRDKPHRTTGEKINVTSQLKTRSSEKQSTKLGGISPKDQHNISSGKQKKTKEYAESLAERLRGRTEVPRHKHEASLHVGVAKAAKKRQREPSSSTLESSSEEEEACTYYCFKKDCTRTFQYPFNYKQHIQSHLKYKPYMCRACDFTALNKSGLVTHITYLHQHRKVQYCMSISRDTKIEARIDRLVVKGKNNPPDPDSDNTKKQKMSPKNAPSLPRTVGLLKKTELEELKMTTKTKTAQPKVVQKKFTVKCCYCKHNAISADTLKAHLRLHLKYKPYECKLCDFSSGYMLTVSNHIKVEHANVKHASVILNRDADKEKEFQRALNASYDALQIVLPKDKKKIGPRSRKNKIAEDCSDPGESIQQINCYHCAYRNESPIAFVVHLREHRSSVNAEADVTVHLNPKVRLRKIHTGPEDIKKLLIANAAKVSPKREGKDSPRSKSISICEPLGKEFSVKSDAMPLSPLRSRSDSNDTTKANEEMTLFSSLNLKSKDKDTRDTKFYISGLIHSDDEIESKGEAKFESESTDNLTGDTKDQIKKDNIVEQQNLKEFKVRDNNVPKSIEKSDIKEESLTKDVIEPKMEGVQDSLCQEKVTTIIGKDCQLTTKDVEQSLELKKEVKDKVDVKEKGDIHENVDVIEALNVKEYVKEKPDVKEELVVIEKTDINKEEGLKEQYMLRDSNTKEEPDVIEQPNAKEEPELIEVGDIEEEPDMIQDSIIKGEPDVPEDRNGKEETELVGGDIKEELCGIEEADAKQEPNVMEETDVNKEADEQADMKEEKYYCVEESNVKEDVKEEINVQEEIDVQENIKLEPHGKGEKYDKKDIDFKEKVDAKEPDVIQESDVKQDAESSSEVKTQNVEIVKDTLICSSEIVKENKEFPSEIVKQDTEYVTEKVREETEYQSEIVKEVTGYSSELIKEDECLSDMRKTECDFSSELIKKATEYPSEIYKDSECPSEVVMKDAECPSKVIEGRIECSFEVKMKNTYCPIDMKKEVSESPTKTVKEDIECTSELVLENTEYPSKGIIENTEYHSEKVKVDTECSPEEEMEDAEYPPKIIKEDTQCPKWEVGVKEDTECPPKGLKEDTECSPNIEKKDTECSRSPNIVKEDTECSPNIEKEDTECPPKEVKEDTMCSPNEVKKDTKCSNIVKEDTEFPPKGVKEDTECSPNIIKEDTECPSEGVNEEKECRSEGVKEDSECPSEVVKEDTECHSEVVKEDTECPSKVLKKDTECRPEGVNEDTECPSEGVNEDNERRSGVKEDSECLSEVVKEDTECPSEVVKEDTESPSEVVKEDTECPSEVVEEDTECLSELVRSEVVKKDTECPPEGVNEDTECPSKGVKEDTECPSEVVKGDTECPSEVVKKDTECPSEGVKEDTECQPKGVKDESECPPEGVYQSPSEVVMEDTECPSEVVKEDTECPSEVIEEDTKCPSEVVKEDTGCPSEGIKEDTECSPKGVKKDSECPPKGEKEDTEYSSKGVKIDAVCSPSEVKGDTKCLNIVKEDTECPSEVVKEDTECSPKEVKEDTECPSEVVKEDTECPSKGVNEYMECSPNIENEDTKCSPTVVKEDTECPLKGVEENTECPPSIVKEETDCSSNIVKEDTMCSPNVINKDIESTPKGVNEDSECSTNVVKEDECPTKGVNKDTECSPNIGKEDTECPP